MLYSYVMQSTEAIILKTVSYLETSHVLTLFSREFGIVSVMLKSLSKNKARSYSALLKVEAEIIPSEKELWKCRGIAILSSYPQLRTSLIRLQVVAQLLELLSKIIPPRTPVQEIYSLLDEHLFILPECQSPYTAAASFLVKYLHQEGSLNLFPFSQSEKTTLKLILEAPLTHLPSHFCEKTLFEKITSMTKSLCTQV
jgi:DNA repair protein RecO